MGWGLDKEKVNSQLGELGRFIKQARGEEPAGLEDIFGRPFQAPEGPPVTVTPQPEIQVNFYLLQLGQLYEAGVISEEEFIAGRRRIVG